MYMCEVCMVCHSDEMCGEVRCSVSQRGVLYRSPPSLLSFLSLLSSLSPPSLLSPQLETKCFMQQEQLDLLQEQLSTEQERSHTAVSNLQKELALRVDQVGRGGDGECK